MSDIAIKIENLKKKYRLGSIGGQTLNAELQSWLARKRGKEDPNLAIGQSYNEHNEEFYALDGIDLVVKKGEAVGIIGGNGAGKSTLLKVLSRVTAPTEGDIWVDGKIASMLEVGTGFHGELTGRENIYMNGAILGMSKKEVDSKIQSIIDFSECGRFIDTPVKRYSSGMYVKLAFAVASHLDSDIMIMDEVLAVGDLNFQKKSLSKMGEEAQSGKTVLYVSHNMATIRSLCTRCIVLDRGKIIFDGDVEKAISVYSRESEFYNAKLQYEFDGLKRRTMQLGLYDVIHSIKILDRDNANYFDDENMTLDIGWSNSKPLDELHFRFVVLTSDSTVVGMCESQVISEAEKSGFHKSRILFSLKNLSPANYMLYVSINCIHQGGKYDMRDEIPEPVLFSVTENAYTIRNMSAWITSTWGNVRFDDLEVVTYE